MRPAPSSTAGFTLLELLLTLAVASIVLVFGIPALGETVARSRQSAEINALFHAFHVARKESIMRRRVVSICPSDDSRSCTPGKNWSRGWIMFENRDRDSPPRVDAGEPLLIVHKVDPRVRLTANRLGFTLRASYLRATNGTFVACDRGASIMPKALVVSFTGRPRVAVETNRGEPYACAD